MHFFKDVTEASSHIELLIETLKYSRRKLLMSIDNLDIKDIDFRFDKLSISIGTILRHLAGFEFYFQKAIFRLEELNREEEMFWQGSLPGQLKTATIKGYSIDYYLNLLSSVRSETYKLLNKRDDKWLFSGSTFSKFNLFSNYFSLFHIVEEEVYHTGQIKMIKVRITK